MAPKNIARIALHIGIIVLVSLIFVSPVSPARNMDMYSEKEVFLISDESWRDVLKLVPLTIWNTYPTQEYPTLIYHQEGNNFDADAIVRFLQQYNASHLSIFGDTPKGLDYLLVSPEPTGAGLNVSQITKYKMNSHLSFWKFESIDIVVISEDDYETGLMASVFASYTNAPLLFDGHFNYPLLNNRRAHVVGKVSKTTEQEIMTRCKPMSVKKHYYNYSLDVLRKAYVSATVTNKVILVNHDDLNIAVNKQFEPEKKVNSSYINSLYSKHSLIAPFLAAAKFEVIISTHASTYLGVDGYVENTLTDLNLPGTLTYLTIVANPRAIPMARENRYTRPALWGNKVVFEEIDPSKVDSKPLELIVVTFDTSTGNSNVQTITSTKANLGSPAIYKDIIVWEDSRNGKYDIYMYDLTKKKETQITTDPNTQRKPAIYGDKIVWMDDRNTYKDKKGNFHRHWDIYVYDLTKKKEVRITTNDCDQKNPAIYADKIVWMDDRNTYKDKKGKLHRHWDIYMYDLTKKKEVRITTDTSKQLYPDIYKNKIVWHDNRNWNWDIYMYDISTGKETRITTDKKDQVHPSISGGRIVWEDNRMGNWKVCIYDISSKNEMLTTSGYRQIRPVVQGDKVIWYSEGRSSVPPVHIAPPAGSSGGRWMTYLYDISKGKKPNVIHHNILTHEHSTFRQEVDGRYYGSSTNYGKQDRIVGRIFGVTSSDVSAYVARDLFFNDLPKNKDALLIVLEDHQPETGKKYLFSLSLNYKQYLKVGKVDAELINKFKNNYLFLSNKAHFKKKIGKKWKIEDGAEEYEIEISDTELNVYKTKNIKKSQLHGPTLEKYAKTTYWTPKVSAQFGTEHFFAGEKVGSTTASPVNPNIKKIQYLYGDSYLILYSDHGGGAGFDNVIYSKYLNDNEVSLLPSTILNIACATCTPVWGYVPSDQVFCMENIRRGAMVYQGAVDLSSWHRMFDNILEGVFINDTTIGEAYLDARNEEYKNCIVKHPSSRLCGDSYYALIGDPTFKPKWW